MASVIRRSSTSCVIVATALLYSVGAADDVNLRITLRDTGSGHLVSGRITVEQQPVEGRSAYHFVKSLDPHGTAVPYDVTRSETSFEKHTTVSAHPFGAKVPPGYYVVSYEHGPEWRGNKAQVQVKEGEVAELELPNSNCRRRGGSTGLRGWQCGASKRTRQKHRGEWDSPTRPPCTSRCRASRSVRGRSRRTFLSAG